MTASGFGAVDKLSLTGGALTGPVSDTAAITAGVQVITDAATLSYDASAGNHFRVTLGGNRTLAVPSNPSDGQKITVEVIQDATGSRTLAYGTAYAFSVSIPLPVLTTTAGKRDFLGFLYNATSGLWYCVGASFAY